MSYVNRSTPLLLGSILGAVFPILICVCFIVCCCMLCKKCHKGSNRRHQITTNTVTVVNTPLQSLPPAGYQPPYPGYQPVPFQPGYSGPPNPTSPPPSYLQATDPAYSSVAVGPGQPMQPMQPFPGQPYAPPPHSNEFSQPPYNPSYCPNP